MFLYLIHYLCLLPLLNRAKKIEYYIFMAERRVHLIHLLSDLGANPAKPGAAKGPHTLMELDKSGDQLFTQWPLTIFTQQATRSQQVLPYAKYIQPIYQFQQEAVQKMEEIIVSGAFPFIMSGDHSNAAATISALKNIYTDKSLGVIWIDAHADMHSPYTTPSGNMHGMPLAICLGLDNLEHRRNIPDEETILLWNQLKQMGSKKIGHKTDPQSLLLIDIRDLEPQETAYLNDYQIKHFTPSDRKAVGIQPIVKQTLAWAANFDYIYVSFDIDSMDEQYVPGTGTPVADGMTPSEAILLLQNLWQMDNLVGFEVTEVNPQIEAVRTPAQVYEVLSKMLKK
jgi:arginase